MRSKIILFVFILASLWGMGRPPTEALLKNAFDRPQYAIYLSEQDNIIEKKDIFIKYARRRDLPVTALYLDMNKISKDFIAFNAQWHKNGEMFLVLSDYDFLESTKNVIQKIEQVVNLNKKYPESKFDGVLFNYVDLEADQQDQLIKLLEVTKKYLIDQKSELRIGLTLSEEDTADYWQIVFNYINFVHYKTSLKTIKEIVQEMNPLLTYAKENNTEVSLILNNTELNRDNLKKQTNAFYQKAKDYKIFRQFVITNFKQWQKYWSDKPELS